MMNVSRGYFVEFGAWDGMHFSNTYALYEKGWAGCYIEADRERFHDLTRNITSQKVINVNAFVLTEGENTLDKILKRVEAPRDLDMLSIDIDSNDLAVWRTVSDYSAKVVVIEYNPTVPFDTEFENPPGKSWGNSALSILRLGHAKNYELISATNTNLIFLRKDVNKSLGIPAFDLSTVSKKARYFWGYDGSLLRSDGRDVSCEDVFFLPWGKAIGVQPMPRPLRTYVDRRSPITSIVRILVSWLTALVLRPVSFAKFTIGLLTGPRK